MRRPFSTSRVAPPGIAGRPLLFMPALAAVFLGAAVGDVRAQLGETIEFKPFSVSFSTRSGFDSGGGASVFTDAKDQEEGFNEPSIYAGFDASGAFNYVLPDSFFGARTTTGYTYYFQREQQPYETAVNVDATFSHTFSPRWTMNINNSFYMDSEAQTGPDSAQPGGAQFYGRTGDYYINNFSMNHSYLLDPRLTLNGGITYGMTVYEEDDAANLYDLQQYGVSVGFSYLLTSATAAGITVGYTRNEHPGKTKLYAPSPPAPPRVVVDKVDRNSENQSVSLTFNHAFSRRTSIGGFVGFTISTFQDGDVRGESVNPAAAVTLLHELDARTRLELTYRAGISQSEIPQFTATFSQSASAGLTRQITSRIPLNLRFEYSSSQYDQKYNATTAAAFRFSGNEEWYGGSISTGYAFTRFLSLNTGYGYQHFASSHRGRSYDRDRISFDVNVRF